MAPLNGLVWFGLVYWGLLMAPLNGLVWFGLLGPLNGTS